MQIVRHLRTLGYTYAIISSEGFEKAKVTDLVKVINTDGLIAETLGLETESTRFLSVSVPGMSRASAGVEQEQ